MSDTLSMGKYKRKVVRQGNSYGVTIPNEFLKKGLVGKDDQFEWMVEDGEVFMKKIPKSKMRQDVLDTFAEVIEQDADILKQLRDR